MAHNRVDLGDLFGTNSIRRGMEGLNGKAGHAGAGGPRGQVPAASRTPKPAPAPKPGKDATAEWNRYIGILQDLVSGLRAGRYASSSPLPPAPGIEGPKGLMAKALELVQKTIPAAKDRAAYNESLKTPGGGSAPPPATSYDQPPAVEPTAPPPPPPPAASPDVTYGADTTSPTYTNTYAPGSPGGGTDAAGNPLAPASSGTVIDPATGQPIAASFFSNKYVWIGAGAIAALWFLSKRKKSKRRA